MLSKIFVHSGVHTIIFPFAQSRNAEEFHTKSLLYGHKLGLFKPCVVKNFGIIYNSIKEPVVGELLAGVKKPEPRLTAMIYI